MAAGADGLEIEVHVDPPSALSDKDQQLTPDAFKAFMRRVTELREFMAERAMAEARGRRRERGDPTDRGGRSARDPFADAMD